MHRRVNRGTLGATGSRALAVDALNVDAITQQGGNVALVLGLGYDLLHKARNARIALEVALDIGLGLLVAHLGLLGQAMGLHAIHQTKVGGLGVGTLLIGNLVNRLAQDLSGGSAVNIKTVLEGRDQVRVLREVRN